MLAIYENRLVGQPEKIWTGKYRSLRNLPHWHLECELIFVCRGKAQISISHKSYDVEAGQSLFAGSGEVHCIQGSAGSIIGVFLFDPSLVREITGRYKLSDALLRHPYPIGQAFREIRAELSARAPFYEIRINCRMVSLMAGIFRGETIEPVREQPEKSSVSQYKALLQEIDRKYGYYTFSDAAGFMRLTESYFSKFFRKVSGMTFSRYLNGVRIEKSLEMLESGVPCSVTRIAEACGFNTIRQFNRVFRQITGTSPKKFSRDYVPARQKTAPAGESFDPTLAGSVLL